MGNARARFAVRAQSRERPVTLRAEARRRIRELRGAESLGVVFLTPCLVRRKDPHTSEQSVLRPENGIGLVHLASSVAARAIATAEGLARRPMPAARFER